MLLTTRQLVADCLAGLSTAQHDYFRDGFQAAGQAAELACPGMDASVLVNIDDASESVKAAGATLALRNAAIARIEAVTRGEGVLPEPTRADLLERAHRAA